MLFHPIANIFPLLEGREFEEFTDDVRASGLREPIVLYEDSVLDGRNRLRACDLAGVPPRFEAYTGDDPLGFVISHNLRRRHLNTSQRAMVAARIANLAVGSNQHVARITHDVKTGEDFNPPFELASANLRRRPTAAEVSETLNIGTRSIEHAREVLVEGAPELIAAVEQGQVSVSAAVPLATLPAPEQREIVARGEKEIVAAAQAINAQRREERRRAKATAQYAVAEAGFSADGPFDCVVIDPPWPMQKIDRDVRPNQDAFDYPTLSIEEIGHLWQREIADRLNTDCHLFMWTTQKFLPAALELLEQFGFRYVFTMVWHKPGGFQPIGLPQYNCEFVVYGRSGAPSFVDTKAFPCCFDAPRREHSRKPDEFYDIVRRVSGGSRLDVFSREKRDGFAQFGNEPDKFSEVE